jgi:hypothetical protein
VHHVSIIVHVQIKSVHSHVLVLVDG